MQRTTPWSPFHLALAGHAAVHPDRVAFSFVTGGATTDRGLTYAALDRRARDIALALRERGVGRGDRVVILLPTGAEYIAGFYGCLYAGAVAVPAYPPSKSRRSQRVRHILDDARPSAVLTTAEAASQLARDGIGAGIAMVVVEDIAERGGGGAFAPVEVAPSELAFLQYTSGSTSAPRGVCLSYANLQANIASITRAFELGDGDALVTWLPPYHDMGLIGCILAPVQGGITTTVLSPMQFIQRPASWLEAIARSGATISGGPNFAYELCARRVSDAELAGLDLSRWAIAFNGAEPVRAAVLERFAERFASAGFTARSHFPCYGLAEATLLVSCARRGGGAQIDEVAPVTAGAASALVECGDVIDELDVAIVDPATGQRRAPGEIGEVWLAGASVAAGYWQRDDASFGAALAGGEPSRGFLRTGDLGYLRGRALVITGRLKDLVIVHGQNHYPQDLELTAEASHAAVKTGGVAAFALSTDSGDAVGLVVETARHVDYVEVAQAVRAAVATQHEVPVEVVVLVPGTMLPRTSSGKVQRSKARDELVAGTLHELYRLDRRGAAAGEAPESAPAGALEEEVAAVMGGVLGVAQIGRERSFFDLGGDSIAAIEIATTLEARGYPVASDVIYAHDTVASLAAHLGELTGASADTTPGAASLAPYTGDLARLPLSLTQERFWDDYLAEPARSWANMSGKVPVPAGLEVDAVRFVFQSFAERHDSLRLSFHRDDAGRYQRVHARVEVDVEVHDLRDTADGDEAARYLAAREREFVNRPFDLAAPPLFRIALVRQRDRAHVLVCFHHMVADGSSMLRMRDEIGELLAAYASGQREPRERASLQYADFVAWQRGQLERGELAAARRYWGQELAGDPPELCFPVDDAAAQSDDKSGAGCQWLLDEELARALESRAAELRASTAMLGMATLFSFMSRQVGARDLIVGTPLSGRERLGLRALVGLTINQCPIRVQLAAGETFAGLVGKVRGKVLSAVRHQHYQTNMMIADAGLVRRSYRLPITNVFFTQLPFSEPVDYGARKAGEAQRSGHLTDVRFDMMWYLYAHPNAQIVECKYRRALFTAEQIEGLVAGYVELLRSYVLDPGQFV